jgi:hypothetical protein
VDAGPFLETFDEPFLTTVAKDVSQALGLGLVLGADQDRLVSPSEDLLPPAGEPADLPGELGVEVPHESGELPGVVNLQDQVEVIGQEREGADPHRVERLCPGERPEDDRVEHRSWAEQEAAVERPAGHLDQGAVVWDEAESSAHAP